jgi:hypothetical protein
MIRDDKRSPVKEEIIRLLGKELVKVLRYFDAWKQIDKSVC